MELNIMGFKLRLEVIILIVILGYVLSGHLICSCSRITLAEGFNIMKGHSTFEGLGNKNRVNKFSNTPTFEGMNTLEGSDLAYSMGDGVANSWEVPYTGAPSSSDDWKSKLESNTGDNPSMAIESGEMAIFSNNKFDPKCCPSSFSSSSGCLCQTLEQADYLNMRGGNRTYGE